MSYPNSPGFKAGGTSSDAARRIASYATTLRDRVYAFLKASVRPRVTELRRSDLVEPTAERRKNKSGMSARCWRAKAAMTGETAQ